MPHITKHKSDCKMSFGKKDSTCPRCQELLAGAAPREGWQQDYYAQQKQANRFLANAKHCCGGCSDFGICTRGT
jgi:hypothetical protein